MEESDEVPGSLHRFVLAEWLEDSDEPWPEAGLSAHKRWSAAREGWARSHGYDVDAKAGEAPGQDWWAFLRACRQGGWHPDLPEFHVNFCRSFRGVWLMLVLPFL